MKLTVGFLSILAVGTSLVISPETTEKAASHLATDDVTIEKTSMANHHHHIPHDSHVMEDANNSIEYFQHPIPRITNGQEAEKHKYPWMAFVEIQTSFLIVLKKVVKCGGSLISTRHVLTAAHCLNHRGIQKVTVGLGMHYTSEFQSNSFEVESYQIHEGFKNNDKIYPINDIALIKLRQPVTFSDVIKPICLTPPEVQAGEFVGKTVTVSGWGLTETGETSDFLKTGSGVVLSLEDCGKVFNGDLLTPGHMCVDMKDGDDCRGDSGGPLIYKKPNGQIEQIGIVSFGIDGVCDGKTPSVFTRISEYSEWIHTNTGDTVSCGDNKENRKRPRPTTVRPNPKSSVLHLRPTSVRPNTKSSVHVF